MKTINVINILVKQKRIVMTKNEQLWYTLGEATQQLNCDIDHLMYLCITNQLELGFDWVTFYEQNCEDGSHLSFTFSRYVQMDDPITNYTLPLDLPNYDNNHLNRIALLNTRQIGLLKKQKQIKLTEGTIGDIDLNISKAEYGGIGYHLTLTISDIVITAESLSKYIHKHSSNPRALQGDEKFQEQEIKHQHQKEIDNLYKIIALSAIYLATLKPNLTHGMTPNCLAISKRLSEHIPTKMPTTGLSERNIRDKISRALKLLET